MSTFALRATVTASTKRGAKSGGQKALPATEIASLSVWKYHPVDGETAYRNQLNTAFEYWQTFTQGDYDLKKGDILVVGSDEREIEALEAWPWRDTTRYLIIVSKLKR